MTTVIQTDEIRELDKDRIKRVFDEADINSRNGIQMMFENATEGRYPRAEMLGCLLDDLGVEPEKIKEAIDNVR